MRRRRGGGVVRGGKDAYVGAHRRRGSAPRVGGAGRTFKSSERRRSRRLDPLPCQLELLAPTPPAARLHTLHEKKIFSNMSLAGGHWSVGGDGIAHIKMGGLRTRSRALARRTPCEGCWATWGKEGRGSGPGGAACGGIAGRGRSPAMTRARAPRTRPMGSAGHGGTRRDLGRGAPHH